MLTVAPCDHKAATFAVKHWHYSQTMPASKPLIRYGVWEHGEFVGAVLYGWGANPRLGKPFGLEMIECAELLRIAMRDHEAPVSQVVARTLADLKRTNPGLRLVVSFADPHEGHHGGIYQAGNWLYLGLTAPKRELELNGKTLNRRAYTGRGFGGARARIPAGAVWVQRPGKHRYVFPLDKQMRRRVSKLAQPYPSPCGQGLEGEPAGFPLAGAGSTPAVRSIGRAS